MLASGLWCDRELNGASSDCGEISTIGERGAIKASIERIRQRDRQQRDKQKKSERKLADRSDLVTGLGDVSPMIGFSGTG